jgi:hypothetical protein
LDGELQHTMDATVMSATIKNEKLRIAYTWSVAPAKYSITLIHFVFIRIKMTNITAASLPPVHLHSAYRNLYLNTATSR